jgi:hypothetical protein
MFHDTRTPRLIWLGLGLLCVPVLYVAVALRFLGPRPRWPVIQRRIDRDVIGLVQNIARPWWLTLAVLGACCGRGMSWLGKHKDWKRN